MESNLTRLPKTCFISAPAGAKLDVLRDVIESCGLRIIVPSELIIGTDWASEIQKILTKADLVIGVVTSEKQYASIFFELGQASALGRRILLITSPEIDPLQFSLHNLLIVRIDLSNREAIQFALEQVLAAPVKPKAYKSKKKPTLSGLSKSSAANMTVDYEECLLHNDWRGLESLVANALKSTGADLVVPSRKSYDRGADLAVWSDVLEPFVGNPLPIEIKARIKNRADVDRAIRQLTTYVNASNSRWAMLLFGEGPDTDNPIWANTPPNILVLKIKNLFELLRDRAFPELVRDLRNRQVHGSTF